MPIASLFQRFGAAALVMLLASCTQSEAHTEVVVQVRSNLILGEEVDTLEVRLLHGDDPDYDADPIREYSLASEPEAGQYDLPLSFSIAPARNDSEEEFRIVLTGIRGGRIVVETQARATFKARTALFLELFLSRACLDVLCHSGNERTGEACNVESGTCETVPVTPLDPFNPNDLDAGPEDPMDSGAQDAGDAESEDSPSDAGPDADGDSGDSGHPIDAGDGSIPLLGDAAVATVGIACATSGQKACAGNNSQQPLTCSMGVWTAAAACGSGTRCQTALSSPEVGTCRPIASACAGKEPGAAVCDTAARATCGPDLLDTVSNPCQAHASCSDTGGSASCACDAMYMSDGVGGCATGPCLAMPCQHSGICTNTGATTRSCDCSAVDYDGPSCETPRNDCLLMPCTRGMCTDGVRTRSCACPPGFNGTNCESNINECASASTNVCAGTTAGASFSYSCVDYTDSTPGYICSGQFPNWNVTTSPSGRYSASAGIVTDSLTGLRWQQTLSGSSYNLDNAKAYCAALSLGTGTWRLPTRAELLSIVDYAQSPAIDPTYFPGTPNDDFWTSSSYVGNQGDAWHVFAANGASAPDKHFNELLRVRCVR